MHGFTLAGGSPDGGPKLVNKNSQLDWLGGRDSNPDTQIQSLQSYR